jgi:hypothetical protein
MNPGQLPIDNLEPDAGVALANGIPVDQVIQLSRAISLRRIADAMQPVAIDGDALLRDWADRPGGLTHFEELERIARNFQLAMLALCIALSEPAR